MIELPYGSQFSEDALAAYIRSTNRNYIIQGQQSVSLDNHSKRDSLDYWLRLNGAANQNTKQADNSVVDALVATGRFAVVQRLLCPNSGTRCKGLRLL
jgi:curli biogenesis system outer membrane secretion channel CsgG